MEPQHAAAAAAIGGGDNGPGEGGGENDLKKPSSSKKNYKSKSLCVFRPEHELAYGIKAHEVDSVTGEVIVAQCLFCSKYGRERSGEGEAGDGDGGSDDNRDADNGEASESNKKRKVRALTKNVRYFRAPFRTDKYTQHLQRQEYKLLSEEDKRSYFEGIELANPALIAAARGISAGKLHANLSISSSKAHKILFSFMRDKNTTSEEFVKYSKRSMRILVEDALAEFPTKQVKIETPCGVYDGVQTLPPTEICAVSIMRSGDALLEAVREVEPACKVGKILIQRNESSRNKQAMLFYTKLPENIEKMYVLLLDPMLATGGSAMLAMKVLCQDFSVDPKKIIFCNMICAPEGLRCLSRAYPMVRIVTTVVDEKLNNEKYILPGLGDFGDRFYNT